MSGSIMRREGNSKLKYIVSSVLFLLAATMLTMYFVDPTEEYLSIYGVPSPVVLAAIFLVTIGWILIWGAVKSFEKGVIRKFSG
jgi:uncharacterized BrkB/YihY/UPF0761 family membrane protein